jgi:hypothetical protein
MTIEQIMAAAIVVATFAGPIIAVLITRYIDDRRHRRERKMEVFRALMRNRRNALAPEYVGALNMIELEFAGSAPVLRAFKTLFDHYQVNPQPADWGERLRSLTARLLYVMAKDLGYDMEQLDVMEGGYTPSAYGAIENDQKAVLAAMAKVARGEAAIPVVMIATKPQADTTPTPVLVASNPDKKVG